MNYNYPEELEGCGPYWEEETEDYDKYGLTQADYEKADGDDSIK